MPRRLIALVIASLTGAALTLGPALGPGAVPAEAAARVTISNSRGTAAIDPTYATTLTLRGTGFQSIAKGHGGIYVFFGTVKGTWQPSKGGIVGSNYLYVPDSESANNAGYQRFVAFPGGDTASSANGGEISASGTWRTTITVPGTTFNAVDRSGQATSVDCTKVTCGIITIGAHGLTNARNETFTPVAVTSLTKTATSSPTSAAPTATAGSSPSPAATPTAPATAAPSATTKPSARLEVDAATSVQGRAMTFTGTGFTPGEQVVVTLDDGVASVGPLPAGINGDIAGVLQVPVDLTVGTHNLRATGAASGTTVVQNFPVTAATDTADETPWRSLLPKVAVAAALLALLASVAFAVVRWRGARSKGVSHAQA